MNPNQARVIDPVLSGIAQGYTNKDRVGGVLFPAVDVPARGGQILEFGKEAFKRINARRAPGADTASISFGFAGKPFQLVQDALNSPVPREILQDASNVPGVDMGTRATNTVMNALTLELECEQADLATNEDSYEATHVKDVSVADKWTNPDSDPLELIEDGKDVVRSTAGVEPNKLVISKPIFRALKVHPKIVERFKYTTADSITTQMMANLFDLDELAVGKASIMSSNDDDAAFTDVWGNFGVLAYVPLTPSGMEEPSYGYTYRLQGNPFVEQPWWDNDKKSWVYGVTFERIPVLTGISSGFLLKNVVAEA